MREEYANLFHALREIFNVYHALRIHEIILPGALARELRWKIVVVFLDGHAQVRIDT